MIRSTLLIASTTLIAGAALAPAAGAAVLGPSTGVSAVRTGATVDVTFTPGALAGSRLKAGRTVDLECTAVAKRAPLLLDDDGDDSGSGADLTWGKGTVSAGGVVHVKLLGNTSDNAPGVADFCDVRRVRHVSKHGSIDTTVARVPLTPAGAIHVDETERATALRHLLQKAHLATGYQPVAALGAGVVGLDTPDATPPVGAVGYWTDGTHATVATLSAAGRRLVIQDLGGNVLRTNVLNEMDPYGEDDDVPAGLPTRPDIRVGARSPDADRKPSPYTSDSPLRPADGIRAALSGRRATVRFTGRAARTLRALRGRRVVVACQTVPAPALFPDLIGEALNAKGGGGVGRVPSHGDAVTATLKGGTGDVCVVIDDLQEVAIAGATPAGRAWMQDLAALESFFLGEAGDFSFGAPGGQAYRPTDQLVALGRKDGFVAMDGPDGAVPVGRVGVWSDGARRAAVAVQSASGRRFMVVDEGDGTGRTNLLSAVSVLLIGETLSLATESSSSSSSGSLSGEL